MITVLATKKFHPDTRKIAVLLVVLGSYNREIIIQAITVLGVGSPKKASKVVFIIRIEKRDGSMQKFR